jgi:hypothetical protein
VNAGSTQLQQQVLRGHLVCEVKSFGELLEYGPQERPSAFGVTSISQ